MGDAASAYLTTRELAELLRIKERKVYDLAASGRIPCSRATGKLLFPRDAVEAWIAGKTSAPTAPVASQPRPAVFLGSYEPLLEWAMRESACGLAMLLDGSADGLARFGRGEGVAAGIHMFDVESQDWNQAAVQRDLAGQNVALVEFAWRERGLIVPAGMEPTLGSIADLRGKRLAPRQAGAGSQVLLEHLLGEAGLHGDAVQWSDTARTEHDAALAVLEDRADACLGLRALASQLRLGFVPLLRERYDILVDRGAWFDPPLQTLFGFLRSTTFAAKVEATPGYDFSGLGQVRYNTPA